MIRFSYEETIQASPEAIFAVISEIKRFDEWLDMDGRPVGSGPVGVGTQFDSTSRLGPMRIEGRGEITSYEPGRRFGFRLVTPQALDFEIDIRLDPADGGARLKGTGSMTTHRLWRLMEPILRAELPKGEAREARRLKAIVEGASATTASPDPEHPDSTGGQA